ncbi:hypothetical protein [Flavobacterium sp. 3HN19-14]|uniref:hypothetical protein n=1 Tax=Flavobacterium sp. 3HN19-14 TaxID=3448133 RepID=UPI003EE0BA1A
MFRTSIAKEIVFENELWFDDRPFLFEYLFKSKTVAFSNERLLKIYKRNASITRRILQPKRITDAHRVFEIEWKIAGKYNAIDSYKNKIAKHQLDVLMDNFIILYIDKNAISDLKEVQQTHLSYLEKFVQFTKHEGISFKIKDKLALQLMRFPGIFGFEFVFFILKFLKKNRIERIRQLKNN